MRLGPLYRLLSRISHRDWMPARLVRIEAIDYPDQIRVYSNGNTSAFVALRQGKVVEAGVGEESYSTGRPLDKVWDKAEAFLKVGAALIYVGGVDNRIEMVLRDKSETVAGRGDGAQYASARVRVGEGKKDIVCMTKVPADLLSRFNTCVERRVPVEILDEFSCSMALTAPDPAKIGAGKLVVIGVIFEHVVYLGLFSPAGLIGASDRDLRSGDHIERLDHGTVAEDVVQLLARDGNFTSEQVSELTMFDMTWRLGEPVWQQRFTDEMASRGFSSVTIKLPQDVGMDALDRVCSTEGGLQQCKQFPLPLLAFLGPEALS